mmetsp:Transcript_19045/g.57134  ORF Transcript_19045/g.57134 Transcript_19045/m.57134 type:complete len:222 (-) Transcript_19045:103-768(-)
MVGTSRPRAARSVAMRTSTLRLRKESRTLMRSSWPMSPCSVTASFCRRSLKSAASFSAPCFDLQKMQSWPFFRNPSTRCMSQGHFASSVGTISTCCTMFSAAWPRVPIVIRIGCRRRSLESSSIFGGKVAEKRRVWREGRTFWTTERIWSSKPICSMRSASSSTTKVQRLRLQPFILMMSMMRPGVAMTISLPFFTSLNCWYFERPPASVVLLSPSVLLNL